MSIVKVGARTATPLQSGLCWHHLGAAGSITGAAREQAKRVTYGIIYGLSAYGLSAQLADQGVTVVAAQQMINSFLACFPGMTPHDSSLNDSHMHDHICYTNHTLYALPG